MSSTLSNQAMMVNYMGNDFLEHSFVLCTSQNALSGDERMKKSECTAV